MRVTMEPTVEGREAAIFCIAYWVFKKSFMLVILTRIADFLLVDILYCQQIDSLIEEMPYDK